MLAVGFGFSRINLAVNQHWHLTVFFLKNQQQFCFGTPTILAQCQELE